MEPDHQRFAVILVGVLLLMMFVSTRDFSEAAPTTTTTTATTTTTTTTTTITTLPDIRSTLEWQTRQRSLNAQLLRKTYPERYLTTTTTTAAVALDTTTTTTASSAPVSVTTTGTSPAGTIQWRPEVEQWRDLVAIYFYAYEVEMALAIIRCESLGDPDVTNPSSGTAGLFQHRPQYWEDRSVRAGWGGYDIYDPRANIAVAAWLVHEGGGWRHWDGCEAWAREQVGW